MTGRDGLPCGDPFPGCHHGGGGGGWLVLRRVKRGGGANIARYALYWFLPDFVLQLKATPPSHLRRFVG